MLLINLALQSRQISPILAFSNERKGQLWFNKIIKIRVIYLINYNFLYCCIYGIMCSNNTNHYHSFMLDIKYAISTSFFHA